MELTFFVTFGCFFDIRVTPGYKDCVVYKTFDELRSFTRICERADAKLNNNCFICPRGDYCHNGDLEEHVRVCVWGVGGWAAGVESGPCALTFARERASSGKSQGVRVSPPRLPL